MQDGYKIVIKNNGLSWLSFRDKYDTPKDKKNPQNLLSLQMFDWAAFQYSANVSFVI